MSEEIGQKLADARAKAKAKREAAAELSPEAQERRNAVGLTSPPAEDPINKKVEAFMLSQDRRSLEVERRVDTVATAVEKTAALLAKLISISDHKPVSPEESVAPTWSEVMTRPDMPVAEPQPIQKETESVVPPTSVQDFVPTSWRDIINKELGIDFNAAILPSSGGDCILRVESPPMWDTRRGDERSITTKDVRVGIIHRATDMQDVQIWVTKFVNNIKKTYPDFKPKH